MTPTGFPHSEIPGSQPVCGFPRLIAACHVLHRLSAPRHPPYTLSSLTNFECLSLSESNRLDLIQLSKNIRSFWIIEIRAIENQFQHRAYQRTFQSTTRNPKPVFGGADRVRTDDLRLARAALSQLSYSPKTEDLGSARG